MSDVVKWLVLVVAILGHLAIVRAAINRGYELGLPQRVWQALVIGLIIVAVAVPILIVRNVGLRGGGWSDGSIAWRIYLITCVLGFVIGVLVLVLRSRDGRAAAQLATKSEVLEPPRNNGTVPALARLPGNQIFTVEIVERQIRLPRLPPQWDGVSILHITDLHMNGTPDRGFFEWASDRCAAMKCDLAAVTGDVMDKLEVTDWLATTLGKIETPLGQYFVLGNHDLTRVARRCGRRWRRSGGHRSRGAS